MDGILVVNKPQEMTSHDVVSFIRKRFGVKKVGHAGTLDPMATGVLVILMGKFTKLSNTFIADDKEYEAAMVLGATSDTGDAWGSISDSGKKPAISEPLIKDAFKEFTGEIEQIPPMYSAVKYNGRKLYDLARKGLSVERKARKIFIKDMKISNISLPKISFSVICSKGTYVRQLCVDIGGRLGCGAYMSGLRRTRSGRFTINEAITVDSLKGMSITELGSNLVKIGRL